MTQRVVAVDNLRQMTPDELTAHLREQRGQLFQVRLQQTIGQVENHRQIRAIRKEIARTMTIQVQARLAAERGEVVVAPVAAPKRAKPAAAAKVEQAPPKQRRARRATEEAPAIEAAPAVAETPAAEAPADEVEVAATDVDAELESPAVTEAEAPDEIETNDETSGAEDAPATDEDEG